MRKLIPLIAVLLLVAGCTDGIVRPKVEGGIRDALTQYIGPAKEYTVHADGSAMSMITGKISRLRIEGTGVQLVPNLLVDHMTIDMERVRFHTDTRELKSVKSTIFEAVIVEDALNRYIRATQGNKSDMAVRLDKSKVSVALSRSIIGIKVPISVTGRPAIRGGAKVDFVADSSSVARLPMPALVVNKVLESVNPVFDMSTMKFPVKLTAVTVNGGSVTIKGSAEIGKKK